MENQLQKQNVKVTKKIMGFAKTAFFHSFVNDMKIVNLKSKLFATIRLTISFALRFLSSDTLREDQHADKIVKI